VRWRGRTIVQRQGALRASRAQRKRDPLGGADSSSTDQSPMALEMRARCERCGAALNPEGAAFVCSYECTFCAACAAALAQACPNCGGELVPRPRRIPKGGVV